MKKLIFFFIFIIGYSIQPMAQWVQTNGPSGQTVFTLASLNSNIYAGTVKGIFKTTNNGDVWSQIFPDTTVVIQSLVVSNSNIYAGTSAGIYLSLNSGTTWNQIALSNQYVLSLSVSGAYIFAGTWLHGIYSSTNSGQTWSNYPIANQDVFSMCSNSPYVYAGAYGIYLSTNNGATWNPSSLNNQNVYSFLIYNSSVYAGTFQNGIYFSTNNGQLWNQSSLANQYIDAIASSGTILLAGANGNGVFMSLNNGANWIQKNEGIGNQTVRSILFDGNNVFVGTNTLVWKRGVPELVGIESTNNKIPESYSLKQNYPNPFNPSTKITYQIPKTSYVTLEIFDYLGQKVCTFVNSVQQAGYYEINFNGDNLSSGIYLYKMSSGDFTDTKKMILIK